MCRAVQRQQVLALKLIALALPVEPARQVETAQPLSAPAWEVLAAAALRPIATTVALVPAFAPTLEATTAHQLAPL
jgi:hypothetical protein